MNGIKFLCFGFFLFLISGTASAQNKFLDSIFKNNKLTADIEAGYFYYEPTGSDVILLPYILSLRRPLQQNTRAFWGLYPNSRNQNELSDNPLIHGAGYVTLHLCDYIGQNFDILASMTGELRGTSYGVYNTGNTIVYPQLRLRYHDSFDVFKRKLGLMISVGNYNNILIDEGLEFYNIDAEALYYVLSYDGFTFEHFHIADLLYSVGLNIDDAVANSFYYTTHKGRHGEIWRFGIGYDVNDIVYGGYAPSGTSIQVLYNSAKEYRNFYDMYAALIPDSSSRIYAQFSNLNGDALMIARTNAMVLGAKKETHSKDFNIFCKGEIRYYGSTFKSNFNEDVVYYRNTTTGAVATTGPAYGNSIGPNLYPLRNYQAPFSQFAVFTEEQFIPYSVGGATLYLDGELRIYKKLFFKANLDINYMTWFSPNATASQITNSASFTYPFYTIGIDFQPAKNIHMFAGVTNKGMNLDNTYQTFYLLRDPYVFFSVTKTVKGFLER